MFYFSSLVILPFLALFTSNIFGTDIKKIQGGGLDLEIDLDSKEGILRGSFNDIIMEMEGDGDHFCLAVMRHRSDGKEFFNFCGAAGATYWMYGPEAPNVFALSRNNSPLGLPCDGPVKYFVWKDSSFVYVGSDEDLMHPEREQYELLVRSIFCNVSKYRIPLLAKIGEILVKENDYENAEIFLRPVIGQVRDEYKDFKFCSLINLSRIYDRLGRTREALRLLMDHEREVESANFSGVRSNYFQNLATLYKKCNKYEQSKEALLKAAGCMQGGPSKMLLTHFAEKCEDCLRVQKVIGAHMLQILQEESPTVYKIEMFFVDAINFLEYADFDEAETRLNGFLSNPRFAELRNAILAILGTIKVRKGEYGQAKIILEQLLKQDIDLSSQIIANIAYGDVCKVEKDDSAAANCWKRSIDLCRDKSILSSSFWEKRRQEAENRLLLLSLADISHIINFRKGIPW